MAETSSLTHHDVLNMPLEASGKQSVLATVAIRAMEILIASVALLLSLPLLLVCAIIVKVSSRGPVIFTQTRVGKDGQSFRMFKLRTMRDNCERNGAVWASDEDPRVVRSCHWMRRSHVDELPQLVNILFGQMALVGPRPEREDILVDLESLYPNIRSRLAVRPGLTGLAQIRWGYDTTPARFRRKLSADLEYIRNRSLSLNLRIIAGTFPKFFDGSSK
jgi:lipopolysaccharide/colanic/teichoic acid biosynthesis glycosyltransferase